MICQYCKKTILNDDAIYCPYCANKVVNISNNDLKEINYMIALGKINDAKKILLQLANNDNCEAMLVLEKMYRYHMLDRDKYSYTLDEQKHWLDKAASLGNEKAIIRIIDYSLKELYGYKFDFENVKKMVESLNDCNMKRIFINTLNDIDKSIKEAPSRDEMILKAIFGNDFHF